MTNRPLLHSTETRHPVLSVGPRARWLAPLLLAMATAGCSTSGAISEQAVEANVAVEESHNRVLLLNILRASEDKPLYFTSLQQLFGPLGTGRLSAGLSLPLSSAAKTLQLGFDPQQPSYNIAVHDSRAFMRGFLSPVSPGIFGYYLRQRWSTPTVLRLFVDDILVVDTDGVERVRFTNRGHSPAARSRFDALLERLQRCELRVRLDTRKQPFGPPVSEDDVSSILSDPASDVYLEQLEDPESTDGQATRRYQPMIMVQRAVLDFVAKPGNGICEGLPDDVGGTLRQASFLYDQNTGKRARHTLYKVPDSPGQKGFRHAIVTLRSPEAMIHHLGVLARAARASDEQGLFVVHSAPGTASDDVPSGSVRVRRHGQLYFVAPNSRSMRVLSLISQVIGLQKESNEFPSVGTFRVLP